MPSTHGPSRSEGARSAARAHLRALREERLKRRRKKAVGEPTSEDETDAVANAAPMVEAEPESLGEDAETGEDDSLDMAPAVPEAEDLPATLSEDPDNGADDNAAPEPEPEDVACAAPAQEDVAEPDPEAFEDPPAPDADRDAATTIEDPEDTSQADQADEGLSALPGAGPGLIWMLERVGVTTIEALADADPSKLSHDLGIVGELLDVDHCVNWAKDIQQTKSETPAM